MYASSHLGLALVAVALVVVTAIETNCPLSL
jgi:hypothetical protein